MVLHFTRSFGRVFCRYLRQQAQNGSICTNEGEDRCDGENGINDRQNTDNRRAKISGNKEIDPQLENRITYPCSEDDQAPVEYFLKNGITINAEETMKFLPDRIDHEYDDNLFQSDEWLNWEILKLDYNYNEFGSFHTSK